MKKIFTWFFWLNFMVMMFIPFTLAVAAKYHNYVILDNASLLAQLWLFFAGFFIFFAAIVGIRVMQIKGNTVSQAESKNNLQHVILVIILALVGVTLGVLRNIITECYIWNILIVYWVAFMFSLVQAMEKFLNRCHEEKIIF